MGKQGRVLAVILALVLGAVYAIVSHPPRLGLDLRGGAQLTLEAQTNPKQGITVITPQLLETAKFVVEQRINGLGVAEATVQIGGDNRILVQLPGVDNPAQAERVIGTTAQLDFRKQRRGTEGEFIALQQVKQRLQLEAIDLESKSDKEALEKKREELKRNTEAIAALYESTGLTGNSLKNAAEQPVNQTQSAWEVILFFDDKGGEAFAKITGELGGTGRTLGIFLDDKIITAPTVDAQYQGKGITGGRVSITGDFDLDRASTLALQLRAGSLPVPIKIVENRTVGASLGADSVQSSIYAGMGGLLLVLVFMVTYYRLLGAIADIALIVYAIITFAALSLIGVTLTLPGIAGFILSIGMAVDSNVLIFERTREELTAGRSLYKSVEAGFNRAWASILDSHVTNLIACGALFWLGTGLVKGFAVTLAVGVVISMFTAITCSRALLLSAIAIPELRKPELFGVRSIGKAGSPEKAPDRSDRPTGAPL